MQCKKCKSTWETDRSISDSLDRCPFCGSSLVDEDNGEPKIFDNSKAALVYIAQKHGSAVLLSKQLKSFFPDYAPQVSKNIKKLVFAVYENNATSILKDNLNSSQADKEIAFKQAVTKLTEAFITQDAAEGIIREFTIALGWQLNMPMQAQQQPQPPQKSKSTPPTGTDIVAKIAQGKTRNLQFGKYQWRVLDIQDDKALLLTEDIIEMRPYNATREAITWEKCTLRHYLNDEFYNGFSSQEQTRILPTRNVNKPNQWNGGNGGWDTTDRIFLLSIEEVARFFGNSGHLPAKNRPPESHYAFDDEFNKERIANYSGKAWRWWLRSPGMNNTFAAFIGPYGSFYMGGYDARLVYNFGSSVSCTVNGVRPALWLNLKTSRQQSKLASPTNLNIAVEIVQGKKRLIQFGKHKWRVLGIRDDKALLLTEDIIETRPYNATREAITWEKCTLRHYLNNEFYDKFNSQEQAKILPTKNTNANNQQYDTDSGNDTTDKVFLLSIEEVLRCFGDSGQLKNKTRNSSYWIDDEFNKERVANYGDEVWWLRSPGVSGDKAAVVLAFGALSMTGYFVDFSIGVRPALWLNLKS
jgi:hypothetical protein